MKNKVGGIMRGIGIAAVSLILAVCLIMTACVFLLRAFFTRDVFYPSTLCVRATTNEYVWAQSANGFMWRLPKGDYERGDYVSVLFWNAGTAEDVQDDIVLRHGHAGFSAR